MLVESVSGNRHHIPYFQPLLCKLRTVPAGSLLSHGCVDSPWSVLSPIWECWASRCSQNHNNIDCMENCVKESFYIWGKAFCNISFTFKVLSTDWWVHTSYYLIPFGWNLFLHYTVKVQLKINKQTLKKKKKQTTDLKAHIHLFSQSVDPGPT